MKKRTVLPIIMSAVLLTACGSSKSDSVAMADSATNYKSAAQAVNEAYDYSYDDYDYASDEAYSEKGTAEVSSGDAADNNTETTAQLQKEMLVYSCNMTIDVLDFKTAVDSFKSSLEIYGGFIENENYSDGGSTGRWYYEDSEKWQSYTGTVRVPCSNYDEFCSNTAELGYLRSKNASVQNLTTEYYDLNATLEIYEAKEQRYIALLAEITDDQYAVAVENELTDIQIEISKLKTRMNTIKTDVAYSYVYITINEVKEYREEPIKTDTFLDRLKSTISDSADSFLDFLEGFLFVMIYLAPYLVIAAIIVLAIIGIKKKIRKNKPPKQPAPTAPAPYDYSSAANKQSSPEQQDNSSDNK